MKLDLKQVLGPLVAFVILAVIGLQTADALRRSGTWAAQPRSQATPPPDPYARLEAQIATSAGEQPVAAMRDPFTYGSAPQPTKRAPARPPAPRPLPSPILTAIVFDNDPRALIRYQDRNYTVKPGDACADLRVESIASNQVVLVRNNGERIVLHR